MRYLRELGFIKDEVSYNWKSGIYEIYQDHDGEFIFSSHKDGNLEIIAQEGNLWLMKPFLYKFFRCEHREKRLSYILDREESLT